MSASRPSLLFVYANDSGAISGLVHYVHKIVSPSTYDCQLCALTYGPAGRRAAWKRAIEELGLPCEFLHRDELLARLGAHEPELPAVFLVREGQPALLIAKPEIDACRDLETMIQLLHQRTRDLVGRTAHASPG